MAMRTRYFSLYEKLPATFQAGEEPAEVNTSHSRSRDEVTGVSDIEKGVQMVHQYAFSSGVRLVPLRRLGVALSHVTLGSRTRYTS